MDERWRDFSDDGAVDGDGLIDSKRAPVGRRSLLSRGAAVVAAAVVGVPGLSAWAQATTSFEGLGETFDPVEVHAFANEYFGRAITYPDLARRTLTTDRFRALPATKDPGYSDFWGSVRTVNVKSAYKAEEKNWFTLKYELVYESGATEHVETVWVMACVSKTREYAPFVECSSGDLQLDYYSAPPDGER